MNQKRNLAGRIAEYFLSSKLTPALVVALTVWGVFAVAATPRQENPQITMPAAIIVTQYPGASAQEVQRLVTERGERVLQQVAGIEHIYAVSNQNVSMMTVLFHVGDDPTKSFVDLYDHVNAHLGDLPPGASQPQITPVSADDLPIIALTLHGSRYNRGQLNAAAQRLIDTISPISGVSTIETYGARERQVDVTVDPVKLAAYGLSPLQIAQALGSTNVVAAVGSLRSDASDVTLHAGTPYSSAEQVAAQIVGVSNDHPVLLSQVANVKLDYTPDDENQTLFTNGPAAQVNPGLSEPAVTIAIAKKPGTNAVEIASKIVSTARNTALAPGITVSVTRNDGEKANDAVNELIERLAEAVIIVVLLLLVLGWREALVVATAIPLTLFVTLGTGFLTGQTINRITLFALILALGLLIDDAIVVVENIHRHYHQYPAVSRAQSTIHAVAEIGSPTMLATLTVVLSFLPMLFVTGMMGPYMRPIPMNVPVAMIASLGIAFAITPWVTYSLLRNAKPKPARGLPRWVAPFRNALVAMLERPARAKAFMLGLAVALAISIALPVLTLVRFRMLPDANQTTFLVSVDAPPSSSIQNTTRVARAVGEVLAHTPEVLNYETFIGTNAVPDLSSLLQGTIFRHSPNQADIRVNLVPKGERRIQSADLAIKLRPQLEAAAERYGATLRILQTPPGPPVRDTVLAKIYGPDPETRRAIAARIAAMMHVEPGVVDVDSSYKPLPLAMQLEVDQAKAALSGIDAATIAQTLGMAVHGAAVSTLHTPDARRPVDIVVRFAPEYRRDAASLGSVAIPSRTGRLVPLSSLTKLVSGESSQPVYRDDYENVTYVAADMAGRSSTYAVISFLMELARDPLPAGYRIDWGGEWHLTLTVFADLGRAMLIAFILIYFVLVARFRSFRTPLVVLAAVPLAFLGVLPGFALLAPFGVYFSATAMIGVIALIGIVVRNSIILIEFIEDKVAEGMPLREALVQAATARTRPIFLTAAAGVLSSIVIAADPVWSGLAWALVFGMSASAVLSVLAIPLLYLGVAEKRTRSSLKPGWAIALLIVAALVLPAIARASQSEPLSLQQAIDTALRANPQYLLAANGVDAAQARVKESRAAFLPGFGLQYSYQHQNYVSELVTPVGTLPFAPNSTNLPLAVAQYTLYDGGLSVAHFGEASAGLASAQASEHAARSAVELQTSKAYFDLVSAIRGAEVADRAVRLAADHAVLAQKRFDVGMIPRAEFLAAQTNLANQQTQSIGAHNAVTLAQNALDAVMNVPLDKVHDPTEELTASSNPVDVDRMIDSALRTRPELAAARDAIGAASLAVNAARASTRPRVGLTASDGNAQPVLMTGYHNQFSVALNVVWTLFDGGYSDGAVATARAGVTASELQLEQLRSSIELEVRQAYANYTSATAQVASAQHLVALADENQRLAEIRYRGGVGTAIELRDAELRDVSAAQEFINAKVALRESLVGLRYAAGLL